MFGVYAEEGSYWAWMDPGAFALVGAASFFGGVSRLTMSLTVIMVGFHFSVKVCNNTNRVGNGGPIDLLQTSSSSAMQIFLFQVI